jgi:hypothetical protein
MIVAREYRTAKFAILNPTGVPCACGAFRGVAPTAPCGAVPGLSALSVGGGVIL